MTTWNAADKDAAVTLSGGDLVASSATFGGVRGTTSKSSGKNSFAVSGDFTNGNIGVGVSLSGAARDYSDANGLGVAYIAGAGGWIILTNGGFGSTDGSSPAATGTDNVVVHVDRGGNLIYFTANGNNLFGGNPAAGTGGIAIPSGDHFPNVAPANGLSATADFTPGSLPSGFSDWDGGGAGALFPSLFTNTNTFFAPTVVGPRELTPALFTNTNSFFAPTVRNRGDLLGTLQANNNTIPTSFSATGSVVVSVGDLVVSVVCQQTNLTVTGVTDNLGNTYTAQNAGTDAGAVTGRAFYSIATTGGTLTSVTAACTTSANDGVHIVGVYKGKFSALDVNIANKTSDVTSPFACPATGTLGQAAELVVSWGVANHSTSWSATSPMLLALQLANSTTIKAALAAKVVSATTTTTPEFTAGGNPTQAVLGTLSFRMDLTQALTPSLFTNTNTFFGPTVSQGSATQNLTPNLFTNSQSFFGPTITTGAVGLAPSLVTNGQTFYGPTVSNLNTLAPSLVTNGQTFYAATVTAGEVTLTPSLVTNTQSFFGPTVTAGAVTVSPPLYANTQTFFGPVVSQGGVTLAPGLLTNTQTFYGPSVTVGAVDLTPGLFTNGQTFYGPTVSVGAVELLPSLFTNGQTFFGPTVTGGGAVTLLPDLVVNTQMFFGPTISGGTVALLPDLVVNDQSFFSPTVSLAVEAPQRAGGRYPWQEHRTKLGDERVSKAVRKKKQKAIEKAEEVFDSVDQSDYLIDAIAELDDRIEALLDARTKSEIAATLKAVERTTADLLRMKAEEDEDEEEVIALLFA